MSPSPARRALLAAALAACTPAAPAAQSPAEWREDLRFLARTLEERHADLFHATTPEAFAAAVDALDARLPELRRHEVVVELMRLAAMVGDAHTSVHVSTAGFRRFRIDLMKVREGLVVVGATEDSVGALGGLVLAFGDTPAAEARERVAPVCARDNDWSHDALLPPLLTVPEVLDATGVIEGTERLALRVRTPGGEERTVVVRADDDSPPVFAGPDPRPLWLSRDDPVRRSRAPYWMEVQEEPRLLFVQLNSCLDAPGEPSLADFAEEVVRTARSERVERLVLDLRRNGGGTTRLTRPLLHALIRLEDLNVEGRLFVLIGSGIFSAAQNLLTDLDLHTNALLVGTPSGGRPNQWGQLGTFELPNSGLRVGHSVYWWPHAGPLDAREAILPDLRAEHAWADVLAGRDPHLEAALAYSGRTPIVDVLRRGLAASGAAEAVREARRLRREEPNAFAFDERGVNALGYELLRAGEAEGAVALFRLNVELHPWAWNAHDSLGEGLAALGWRDEALASYRRSLELDRSNANARARIERLERPGRPGPRD